jgi:hypothetical protein
MGRVISYLSFHPLGLNLVSDAFGPLDKCLLDEEVNELNHKFFSYINIQYTIYLAK